MASTAPSSGLVLRVRQATTRQMMPTIASAAEYATTGRSGRPPFVKRKMSPAPRANIGSASGGRKPGAPPPGGGAEKGRGRGEEDTAGNHGALASGRHARARA